MYKALRATDLVYKVFPKSSTILEKNGSKDDSSDCFREELIFTEFQLEFPPNYFTALEIWPITYF